MLIFSYKYPMLTSYCLINILFDIQFILIKDCISTYPTFICLLQLMYFFLQLLLDNIITTLHHIEQIILIVFIVYDQIELNV